MPRTSTRPGSTGASSTPTAPTRGTARAAGLWSGATSPQADVRALDPVFDPNGSEFDVELRDRVSGLVVERLDRLRLAMAGRHNVQNALAAIAVARELSISDEVLRRALARFGGVKRRFTRTGTEGDITVVDDYGHHPVEIRAVLETARQAYSCRVIAVVQPHRYTRLQ